MRKTKFSNCAAAVAQGATSVLLAVVGTTSAIKAGDEVEVEISGIAALVNRVRASQMRVVGLKLLPLCLCLATVARPAADGEIPPDAESAVEALNSSPRHGEWVDIGEGRAGASRWGDSVRAWVVYPERATRAPVVVVIHEIYGLTDWIRAVADRLAAEGFIAIAPDLLSGHGPDGGGTPADRQAAVALVRGLRIEDATRRLTAAARYGTSLAASNGRFGSVGFCWGGGMSFNFAANEQALGGAIVYYGTSPTRAMLGRIQAPVLGLYGGDDARVNATIPDAVREMRRLGKSYEPHQFSGAGHAFLRQQDGRDGANMTATREAWALTIDFLRAQLDK